MNIFTAYLTTPPPVRFPVRKPDVIQAVDPAAYLFSREDLINRGKGREEELRSFVPAQGRFFEPHSVDRSHSFFSVLRLLSSNEHQAMLDITPLGVLYRDKFIYLYSTLLYSILLSCTLLISKGNTAIISDNP
nr:MAG TPA: hypothetical protein [Caudoviricetes sp.]